MRVRFPSPALFESLVTQGIRRFPGAPRVSPEGRTIPGGRSAAERARAASAASTVSSSIVRSVVAALTPIANAARRRPEASAAGHPIDLLTDDVGVTGVAGGLLDHVDQEPGGRAVRVLSGSAGTVG